MKIKSQQTIIYEHQKEVSQNIPSKFTPRVPGEQTITHFISCAPAMHAGLVYESTY